jgi:hypothetical protein
MAGWQIWTPDVIVQSGAVRNDLWSEVRRVGIELQQLSTAVLAGTAAEVSISRSGGSGGNSTSIVARAWAEPARGAVTVVVVNLAKTPAVFDFTTKSSSSSNDNRAAGSATEGVAATVTALFEGLPRTVAPAEATIGTDGLVTVAGEVIEAWGTRAYRIDTAGTTVARSSTSQNLVRNPSLELQHITGVPDEFRTTPICAALQCYQASATAPVYVSADGATAKTGYYSARLFAPVAGLPDNVTTIPTLRQDAVGPLKINATYTVSLWAKAVAQQPPLSLRLRGCPVYPPLVATMDYGCNCGTLNKTFSLSGNSGTFSTPDEGERGGGEWQQLQANFEASGDPNSALDPRCGFEIALLSAGTVNVDEIEMQLAADETL